MFKETLLIKPQVDSSDLNAMERVLNSRFARVGKKFGKGLATSLLGGGVAGAALGLIDKLINPLQATQEAIDRTLAKSDDIVTNSKQFGTTPGKLLRLQSLAAATGLKDTGSLDTLILKFQTAVAEATKDPKKQTAVRQFVGEKDSAEAFFNFIQSLQKMEKNQQLLVQTEIFGEKQILKMADFLNADFGTLNKQLGGPTSAQLDTRLNKASDLNDLKDLLEAQRLLNDTYKKAGIINEGMIRSQNQAEIRALQLENSQIKSYNDLAAISNAANEIINMGKEAILGITSIIVKVTDLTNNVKKLAESPMVRGIKRFFGGGGD